MTNLEPNWAQRKFLDVYDEQRHAGKPVRIITLKARQLGMSTITEAVMFCRSFVFPSSAGLVVAHENDSSEHLFGMTQLYWDTCPWANLYSPKYASKKELVWRETGSSIHIATARNIRAGRGRTLSSLHASEVGFWDRADDLMLGLRQSVPDNPNTMIVLESTANGVGNWFYNTWKAAEVGDNEYYPLFFSWWHHPEYKGSYINVSTPLSNLSEEERVLTRLGVDDDHMIWRRWAIANLCGGDINRFHQEYPSTPEEAFIVSGTNVFPHDALKQAYEPMEGAKGHLIRHGDQVEFKAAPDGPLTIYRAPSSNQDWGQYYVGGDPTRSTFGDYACAQVINRRTYEQVAVYRRKCDPMTFGEELAKLGVFYNTAGVAPEVEGPGYATVGRLVEIDYPRIYQQRWADKHQGKIAEMYGWSTTWKRKEWAVGHLIKLLVDSDLTIHDKHTYQEMRDYITLDNGGYGPADAKYGHDDTVMSLAIACICSSTDGPPSPFQGPTKSATAGIELPITEDDRNNPPPWEEWQ